MAKEEKNSIVTSLFALYNDFIKSLSWDDFDKFQTKCKTLTPIEFQMAEQYFRCAEQNSDNLYILGEIYKFRKNNQCLILLCKSYDMKNIYAGRSMAFLHLFSQSPIHHCLFDNDTLFAFVINQKENPLFSCLIAHCFYYGIGVEQDIDVCHQYMKQAIKVPDSHAMYMFGIMLPDKKESFEQLSKASSLGNPHSMTELCNYYLKQNDFDSALDFCVKAYHCYDNQNDKDKCFAIISEYSTVHIQQLCLLNEFGKQHAD